MSDEIPRDEWLTSGSRDTDEARRADELEMALAAALMRVNAEDGSLLDGNARRDAHVTDERLATMLVEVGKGIMPDADFAAHLQEQIERRIRERGGGGAGEVVGASEAEADGTTRGNGAIAGLRRGHHTRLWSSLRRYRPLWAALAALLLLTFLVTLPSVRAALRQPLCLGSVCIVWDGSPRPTAGPEGSLTPTPLPSVLDLAGRTTLAQARAQARFSVRLPSYPTDLGQPAYVYLQDLDGSAVVMVWVEHAHPDRVRLSLSELSSGIFVYKFATQPVAVTTVHGQRALWTTGPYLVELQNGAYNTRQFVTGHVLIWTEGAITYRLETSVSLDEAVRIAESLR